MWDGDSCESYAPYSLDWHVAQCSNLLFSLTRSRTLTPHFKFVESVSGARRGAIGARFGNTEVARMFLALRRSGVRDRVDLWASKDLPQVPDCLHRPQGALSCREFGNARCFPKTSRYVKTAASLRRRGGNSRRPSLGLAGCRGSAKAASCCSL